MPGCHGRLAGVMGGLVGIAVGMVVEDLAERPVELHVVQRRSQSRRHHRRDLAFGLTTSLAWRAPNPPKAIHKLCTLRREWSPNLD